MEDLKKLFVEHFDIEPTETHILTPHGSQRKYMRLQARDFSTIGTLSSNTKENRVFIALSAHLLKHEISVPKIYRFSDDYSSYLQEDCGSEDLYSLLTKTKNEDDIFSLLTKAVDILINYQSRADTDWDYINCYPFPIFNTEEIRRDFTRFEEKFLQQIPLAYDKHLLSNERDVLSELISKIDTREYTMMHRDFQARNILIYKGAYILIDFQNCRKGPIYYDLASFLFQSQINYTQEMREKVILYYVLHTPIQIDSKTFRKNFYLLACVRLIQSIGSYGIAGLMDKKEYFLQSIPLALQNLEDVIKILKNDFNIDFPYLYEIGNLAQDHFSQ